MENPEGANRFDNDRAEVAAVFLQNIEKVTNLLGKIKFAEHLSAEQIIQLSEVLWACVGSLYGTETVREVPHTGDRKAMLGKVGLLRDQLKALPQILPSYTREQIEKISVTLGSFSRRIDAILSGQLDKESGDSFAE